MAALGLSLVISVCYFIELRAQGAIGQYVSRDMLRDLVGWAAANPSVVRDYVTPASLIKLGGLIVTLLAIVVIARLAQRADDEQCRQRRAVSHDASPARRRRAGRGHSLRPDQLCVPRAEFAVE